MEVSTRSKLGRPTAVVLGAGPAGLMAAEKLSVAGVDVTIFDRMPSVARKFLMAGRGGLNLTHSEPLDRLLNRFGAGRASLEPAIRAFPPDALRAWADGLGAETFIGTSGRVFPKALKASPLLRAWLRRLDGLGVVFRLRSRFVGFGMEGETLIEGPDGRVSVRPDMIVLAFGGASWPRLGSDGLWAAPILAEGVSVAPMKPANCGFRASWTPFFVSRFAGAPIKRAGLAFEGRSARGEAVVTAEGIEGGMVYALSAQLRDAIERDGEARPTLDLRPDIALDDLARRIAQPRAKRSLSTHLAKTAGLAPVAVALLREAGPAPEDPEALARLVKAVPLRLTAAQGIERAISSAGGVRFDEIDHALMLKRRPGVFVAGEMLDWEAPTGGYLLQACLATGVAAAQGAIDWLAERDSRPAASD